MALVQEGDELARYCEGQLREAEGKIVQLVERLGGVEFEAVEEDEEGKSEKVKGKSRGGRLFCLLPFPFFLAARQS